VSSETPCGYSTFFRSTLAFSVTVIMLPSFPSPGLVTKQRVLF
jgi:hypothetical protein